MSLRFNYRHLYYFWVVAKEGGMARAAARMDMAVQTVSAQVRELERALGHALLKPRGRGLELTDAGRAALAQAEQIFHLGEHLPARVRDAGTAAGPRLAVGIADALPKLAVPRLLKPALALEGLRLLCHEDEFDDLLADLALHRLDVVLADRAAPPNPNLKLYSHLLGSAAVAWYAPAPLPRGARKAFPQCLATMPLLLPTQHTAIRVRLDQWFEREEIRPRIVGEFEDSALLATFGASGMGAFPATVWSHDDLTSGKKLELLGTCTDVEEHFYAICTQRKVQHPVVRLLLPGQA